MSPMSEQSWDNLTLKTQIQYLKDCVNGHIKESGSEYHYHYRHGLICKKEKRLVHIDLYRIDHLGNVYRILHDGRNFIEIIRIKKNEIKEERIWWKLTPTVFREEE